MNASNCLQVLVTRRLASMHRVLRSANMRGGHGMMPTQREHQSQAHASALGGNEHMHRCLTDAKINTSLALPHRNKAGAWADAAG